MTDDPLFERIQATKESIFDATKPVADALHTIKSRYHYEARGSSAVAELYKAEIQLQRANVDLLKAIRSLHQAAEYAEEDEL